MKAAEILVGKGYRVEVNKSLTGSSGVSHRVDILAVRGEEKLLVEFLRSRLETELISIYAR